jgi:hypothetical protein
MSLHGTEDKPCSMEGSWYLFAGDYSFETASAMGREKAMAFARILGYLHTDGCLSFNEKRGDYSAVLYMGCLMDTHSIMSDVVAVTGKMPKINDAVSITMGSKSYSIYLPYSLARAFAALPGMTVGSRNIQEVSYPKFLMDPDCPKSIVREFLAGCFSGDGWTTYLSGNQFSNVGFSQSICSNFLENLEVCMGQFVDLMATVGVEAHVSRTRYCPLTSEPYPHNSQASVEIIVASNTEFYEKIGFRHCIEKQIHLEATVAYEGYCKEVRRQHDAAMAVVDASMLKGKSYLVALDQVKNMYETEKPLNEYYSLLTRTMIGNRRRSGRSTELRVFDYNYMLSAPEWLKAHGCIDWFSRTLYVIRRDATDIPTYTMGLMKSEVSHDAPVYDIGVSQTHYFIAQGCAVHNCIPSRMTIAQLMETLLGRLGCEEGFLGDATPFNTAMTAAGLADELQKRGLEPYSNEVLYCGYTGKQMATNIFMGPCFYQRLKHMVADKIHSRATGPLVMLTRQPAEGRARDGGLRFGEMERDVMIAHGASAFLKERMMEASDNFEVHVCKGCGLIGVANKTRNIWNCTGCGNTTEFSQVRIPYAYKLFLQELESMNISSRILPESRLRLLTDGQR